MITFTYDAATVELNLDLGEPGPWGDILCAQLNRHGMRLDISGLQFGVSVEVDGQEVLNHTWPVPGNQYLSTDQDTLAYERAFWEPGCEVMVRAWASRGEESYEVIGAFTAPEPEEVVDAEED